MRFAHKVCVVSGAGSGIVKAVAQQFGAEGAQVVVADLKEQHGNQTVREIEAAGGRALFTRCNVGVGSDVHAAVRAAVDTWNNIDVVVNDAAMDLLADPRI